ncbi:MAG: Predicted O-methyltransferase YrrM [Candidatus Kentron sp. G]|nr:MAG: Predicted O-methyltransferase YrrM [Candidatus Kentron sp. G]VFM96449.1 MAG: Predicted O-methyltransferase YrrM [Candidatus Kentron sp. G]
MRDTTHRFIPATDPLREVFENGRVQHPDGHYLDVKANISKTNSDTLGRFVRERRPALVVEIGMAYGISTLSILEALRENGHGRLISIDPYIGWPTGRLVALHQIRRAGLSHLHEHLYEPSFSALPGLLGKGLRPDLIYIDGCHDFDYVFVDAFLSDKLLDVGGTIAFNDAGWFPVCGVIRFLTKYRKYRELPAGLPKVYRSRNIIFSLIKRLAGCSSSDRYLEKK